MKKALLITFLSLILTGCASTEDSVTTETTEEASWAYEFVKVNSYSYMITKEEVDKSVKGDLIGEVQRNIVDLDTAEDLEERHLDSNSLPPGTALYNPTENNNIILYELNGRYYIAERRE
ncbi:hypothetical protein FZC76_14820 [Sutcliffiella horikoshii]|uniref:Lipoprotein n=1 Tax=Sutcliffiella horikoshii TaxID=79883 RepID=A0A5D4SXZ4_9BACI|nr:hypothetical protein [Sutcliffiella horikoshii]TYS67829.1 hypothetical protein FZC76_14820 [Sutcliffiella horikoshii]